MELIEQYQINDSRYYPFLIPGGWKFEQLNYFIQYDLRSERITYNPAVKCQK